MKLLVTSINFHPDHSGIALYATDLPAFAASRGHAVTMVTGFSYYPHWRKRDADRGSLLRSETFSGVRVLRGYLYVPRKVTTRRRILHELTFACSAFFNFLRAGPHDCVVVLSPPLLLGLLGVVFKKLWGATLVLNVQDLQPDAALSLGMVKPSRALRMLLRLEAFVYRHSDLITTISEGMRDRLLAKGARRERTIVCPNWIDVVAASRHPPAGRFRADHPDAAGKVTVAYAGNIGAKQGLDVFVDLAAAMRDDRGVQFFLIGEGAEQERLCARAAALGLRNLTRVKFLGADAYREMLADVDVSFVAQRAGTGNVFFPSKLLGIMAMAKPLLISADPDSELATFVREHGCGLVASADDVAALAAHVRALAASPERRARLGRNGATVVRRFDRDVVLSELLERVDGVRARRVAFRPDFVTTANGATNGVRPGELLSRALTPVLEADTHLSDPPRPRRSGHAPSGS